MEFKLSNYNYITNILGEEGSLIYNFYSNGLVKLNEEYIQKLQRVKQNESKIENEFSASEIQVLRNNGFIVDLELNELYRIVQENNTAYMHNNRMHLTVLPTLACNFDCHYCFEGTQKSNVFMNDEIIKQTGEFIKYRFNKNPYLNDLSIHLFGGEPTIAKKQLEKFFTMLENLHSDIDFSYTGSITTNGYELTNDLITLFTQHNINEAMVSFDGPAEFHDNTRTHKNKLLPGTYRTIFDNCVKYLRFNNANRLIGRIHINNDNTKDFLRVLHEFPKDVRERIYPQFVPVFDNGTINYDFENEFPKLVNIAKELGYTTIKNDHITRKYNGCEYCAAYDSYLVSADGKVSYCSYQDFSDNETPESLVLGHISNYKEIFNSTNFYNFYGNNFMTKQNCVNCLLLPVCGGGCRIKDYQETNFTGDEPCPMYIDKLRSLESDINNLYLGKLNEGGN